MALPPLFISDLRGGINQHDPPFALPDRQVVVAENIDWSRGTLGGRRLGHRSVPAAYPTHKCVFLHRHLPTADETAAELFMVQVSGTQGLFTRVATTGLVVPTPGAMALDVSRGQYAIRAQSLHGKLFVAYPTVSGTDRLHVWDGTQFRPTGLVEPGAPTVTDRGTGVLFGSRYYRTRETRQVNGVTVLRSEPSEPSALFTPSGTGQYARVTKAATANTYATHWEVEASVDGTNFYRLATVPIGTSVYDDDSTPYMITADETRLSEDIGDYTLLHNPKFLSADQDRLLLAGSWEQPALGSRIAWTPVFGASGVGNDERFEEDTDPFLDLDGYDGGEITDFVGPVWGYHVAFKWQRIYKIIRRHKRNRAYEAQPMTSATGAVPGSAVLGLDEAGRPAVYYLDPYRGPSRIGSGGIEHAGTDIERTWASVNLDADKIAHGVYDAERDQVLWWIATDGSATPNKRIVLNVRQTARTADGVRFGWSIDTGPACEALCSVMYSDNYASLPSSRSRRLKPFVGTAGPSPVLECHYGDTDNGTSYRGYVRTKPMVVGALRQKVGVTGLSLMGKASETEVTVSLIADYGRRRVTRECSLAPSPDGEDRVITHRDDLVLSECQTLQVEYGDAAPGDGDWVLDAISVALREEETR